MKRDEFRKIVKGMKCIWTKYDFIPDQESFSIWYELLKDLPYEECNIAVKKYAMTNVFPPTVAEIREQAILVQTDIKVWSEGWQDVVKAVGQYGQYNEEDAVAGMDEITARTVKRLGWKQICLSNTDELVAIRANFRMIYEQEIKHEKELAALPADLKEQIARIGSGTVQRIGGGE